MAFTWTSKSTTTHKGVEDMLLLSKPTEDQITENLRKRIQNDLMFTYIGPTLVAVNPYKKLPYFTSVETALYHGSQSYEHPPHIYALADRMFSDMISEGENQCVIISGESGAGKTECAKLIMNYIAEVSSAGIGSATNIVDAVKNIIIESNPLLEAFGNAKTLRNNNSSRFGKYFEINFGGGGAPMGGKISNFLLEKSRVVGPGKGERNFHVFYQMCSGVTSPLREQLGLTDASYFNYLSVSQEFAADGIDDKQEFKEMSQAMDICQITASEKQSIFQIVCAILHLGNIEFEEGEDGSKAHLRDPETLAFPCFLLGVEEVVMREKLMNRVISTGVGKRGSSYTVPLNVEQARGSRDALSKALYTRMFDWIVMTVNQSMARLQGQKQDKMKCLGVLDIFGFEIFETNGFEQFCINFVNEKLQQIFIELTLKSEQEEYQREGIQWTPIDYFNNQIVVDLIESKKSPGVMAILDDVCSTLHAVTEGADSTFLQKLQASVGTHKHFKGMQFQFVIQHYAGAVTYDCGGFTEANKDTLFKDLILLAQTTSNPFVRLLFPDIVDEGDKKRPTTVSFKIKNQANELVSTLMKCTPSYVRCIKPNETKKMKDFDTTRVLHQVRYLNLTENIKVRRAGFCYRSPFDKFARKFALLTSIESNNTMDKVTDIMKIVDGKEWQLGTTKVFIKSPESLFLLEESIERLYNSYAKTIQRAYRRYKSIKYFLDLRKTAALLVLDKKERKRNSINRHFIGDYLNVLDDPILLTLINSEKTLFSDSILKYDRTFKSNRRELIVTSHHIFLLGTDNVKGKVSKVVKRRIPFNLLSGVTLSTRSDDFILITVTNAFDTIFENQFKTELVTVLSETYLKVMNKPLQITYSDTISYTVKKTRWQSGGSNQVRFSVEDALQSTVVKNNGKVTDIKVAKGLDSGTRMRVAGLFDKYSADTKKSVVSKSSISLNVKSNASLNTTFAKANISNSNSNVSKAIDSTNGNKAGLGKLYEGKVVDTAKTDSKESLALAAAIKKKPPPPPLKKKKLDQCKALYRYEATEADELSFEVGDVIVVSGREDIGWWTGTCKGRNGLFPSNYVEQME